MTEAPPMEAISFNRLGNKEISGEDKKINRQGSKYDILNSSNPTADFFFRRVLRLLK
jgi:hypothetical protein